MFGAFVRLLALCFAAERPLECAALSLSIILSACRIECVLTKPTFAGLLEEIVVADHDERRLWVWCLSGKDFIA